LPFSLAKTCFDYSKQMFNILYHDAPFTYPAFMHAWPELF
jgi:hypothetical protein